MTGGGEPLAPTTVPPGGRARARLRLESPLVVTRGDRFVLRAYSPVTTIGGGLVIDPHPARGALRTPPASRASPRSTPVAGRSTGNWRRPRGG